MTFYKGQRVRIKINPLDRTGWNQYAMPATCGKSGVVTFVDGQYIDVRVDHDLGRWCYKQTNLELISKPIPPPIIKGIVVRNGVIKEEE